MQKYQFKLESNLDRLLPLIKDLEDLKNPTKRDLDKICKKYPGKDGGIFGYSQILGAYKSLAGSHGLKKINSQIVKILQKKPIRTISGVTPVTILTKPFPCPGKCIFCPSDVRMPKSYLSDEPGAQRAERNFFDPYLQTYSRLEALSSIGHNIDKVEIIILGGTWSFYPENYQIWFIKQCFKALNDFGHQNDCLKIENDYFSMEQKLTQIRRVKLTNDPIENKNQIAKADLQIDGKNLIETYNHVISNLYIAPEKLGGFDQYQIATWDELFVQQKINETANIRCVGLVIETRPDNISQAEVLRIRKLGCTKTQIGVQSLSDNVLTANKRGHDVAATRRAFKLLRQAGFKIHAHWMANLYGSSVENDKKDFDQLFSDPDFLPDELKIYPCSLIASAELMSYYQQGLWRPYDHDELLEVVGHTLISTPSYCRLTRIIRDIPSTDIVVGNKKTNFRQISEQDLLFKHQQSSDIRAREIKSQKFDLSKVRLEQIRYLTSISQEIFLQFVVKTGQRDDTILAFLRLSLPKQSSFIPELKNSSIIREVHVYGPAVGIGKKDITMAQHGGFGTQLIKKAKQISQLAGYENMAVISSIGTREYYRKKGFVDGQLYQHMDLRK